MPGRTRVAAPGEPQCPAEGCERPAGFATDHAGSGFCRRHEGGRTLNRRTRRRLAENRPAPARHPADPAPSPTPRPSGADAACTTEASAPATDADPLARRLTANRTNPATDPLAVLRRVLELARRAGFPFEQAWPLGAEAALSYLSSRRAEEWWEAMSATERAWAEAYTARPSSLAKLNLL